ncbi:deoxyribodipyrimidine photo-lyase [Halomicroarcula sp. F13]|uniref:Deoxyribodipyrimidine photo-lyase n=1 Tax=Haloarcula rubra TaxID=2487747 RepID=A0AAW4PTS7_9EURY|nr:FAD-binding domain-containing protein [Halomicroarcula rubra]MBX0324655.1 deoxyribodipyrimidine photo-lyase [Halomicroarcula rubra]
MSDVVVWHRADLRTVDNAALAAATDADRIAPVFVVDPGYYGPDGLACDARLRFLHECLTDLRQQYRSLGSDLALLHGDPRERLSDLLAEGYEVYVNRDVTARRGLERDRTLLDREGVTVFADDGIRWPETRDPDGTVAVDTREDWDDHCEAYFEGDPHPRPGSLGPNPIDSEVTVADVEAHYDVSPSKSRVPEGGTVAGNERLSAFVERLGEYPSVVSPPAAAEARSSRLSPYLKFGALSHREVYQRVQAAPSSRGRSMYTSRLYWNRHYHQKLADWPGWTERAVNPVFRGLFRDEHDPELDRAWREGRTGFPAVDAAMRALTETGYVNFRWRALVATFYVYVLKQWWKRGADFVYYHLVDADPAINYTQWQSQCNLTGVHPVRVYDSAKQVREYDPDGEFVREYVPEIAALPDEHLARPERTPVHVQRECGVDVGEDYPYPVVDYDHEAERARDLYASLADRAEEALSDPRVRRRCSFSNRGRDRTDGDDGASGQASLSDF